VDDAQLARAMELDDALEVDRVLADGPQGRVEQVRLRGEGQGASLVRKRIPWELANPVVWAATMGADEPLLPQVECLYRMPDGLVVLYDYVEGQTLEERVTTAGPLGAERAARLMADLCRAVGVLHARGVVHRDVKPSNVVLADDGAHLIDLGIARLHSADALRDTTTLGTMGYAAPEQFGFGQTDARSDVYALGRVLQFALTGAHPRDASSVTSLEQAGVSPKLRLVINRACALEPSARYQSAADLATAVSDAVQPGALETGANLADALVNDSVEPAIGSAGPTNAPAEIADSIEGRSSSQHQAPSPRGARPAARWRTVWAQMPAVLAWIWGNRRSAGSGIALAALGFVAFADVVMLGGGIQAVVRWPSITALVTLLIAILISAFLTAATFECVEAALFLGPYRGEARRGRLLLLSLASHFVACSVAEFLVCLLTLA
jgi:hypothetical protein